MMLTASESNLWQSFSPPVPDDAALAAMSDAAFDSFLDTWVDKAEAAAYAAQPTRL